MSWQVATRMSSMRTLPKRLMVLVLLYMSATLIHFIHNAEVLIEYPGLPESWTRAGVYFAWVGLTTIGIVGLILIGAGFRKLGLATLAAYCAGGIDSLGHYVLAPFSSHTAPMNATILLEVCTAILLLAEVVNLAFGRASHDSSHRPAR